MREAIVQVTVDQFVTLWRHRFRNVARLKNFGGKLFHFRCHVTCEVAAERTGLLATKVIIIYYTVNRALRAL